MVVITDTARQEINLFHALSLSNSSLGPLVLWSFGQLADNVEHIVEHMCQQLISVGQGNGLWPWACSRSFSFCATDLEDSCVLAFVAL